jgi:hypothetical protein
MLAAARPVVEVLAATAKNAPMPSTNMRSSRAFRMETAARAGPARPAPELAP